MRNAKWALDVFFLSRARSRKKDPGIKSSGPEKSATLYEFF